MTVLNISDFNIQEVSWDEVRHEMYAVNPELVGICDQINLSKEHTLFKLHYSYGDIIINKGKLHLSTNHGLIAIDDIRVPSYINKSLNYSHIPLSLITSGANEVFVEVKGGIISLNFFITGNLFGLFEIMDMQNGILSQPIWSVSAGGRSVFMLPRIADMVGHNRIKKEFGIKVEPPQTLSEQWKVFVDICKNAGTTNSWSNTIIVFTKQWFENNDDASWLKFYKYLSRIYWVQSQLLRDITKFELLWAYFINEIHRKGLKPRPYIVDTIKYLSFIADCSGVAFKPATNEEALPMNFLQDVYNNYYKLSYIPTIMQPGKLNENNFVYYSLYYPIVFGSLSNKNVQNIIQDERDIKLLMDILIKITNNDDIPIKHVHYDFFHTDKDIYEEIKLSQEIVQTDKRFLYLKTPQQPKKKACINASFFKGCIRVGRNNISKINNENNL